METKEYSAVVSLLESLLAKVDALLLPGYPACESQDTKEIATAFAKAQTDYPLIGFDRDNPFFKSKYVTLDAIMIALRPILNKHGISLRQYTILKNGEELLCTKLEHSSGQWFASYTALPAPKNDQAYGSTLSYKKRYQVMSLLGITASNDPDDDDGERSMKDHRPEPQPQKYGMSQRQKPTLEECLTKEQLDELEFELHDNPEMVKRILIAYKKEKLQDLPKSAYRSLMTRIRENKSAAGN